MAGNRPTPPAAPSRSRRFAMAVGLPLLGTVSAIALWWLALIVFGIESYLVPTPLAVATTFARLPGYLLHNTWVTMTEVLQGFGITVVLGVAIGLAISSSRLLERAISPVVLALNAVPKLALAPLLVAWWGFGQGPKVVMVVLVCFFPIVLSTTTGLTSTSTELIELSRSLSASRWQTFVKVRIHAALPQIFVGLKTAMPLAVIGAVIGEFSAATAGLGFVIQNAGSDTAASFSAIALLAVMSVVLFYALVAVERLMLPWVRETTA